MSIHLRKLIGLLAPLTLSKKKIIILFLSLVYNNGYAVKMTCKSNDRLVGNIEISKKGHTTTKSYSYCILEYECDSPYLEDCPCEKWAEKNEKIYRKKLKYNIFAFNNRLKGKMYFDKKIKALSSNYNGAVSTKTGKYKLDISCSSFTRKQKILCNLRLFNDRNWPPEATEQVRCQSN